MLLLSTAVTIIGGASLDQLYVQGQWRASIGGAGLYTSLAAQRAGAPVTMFAPRPAPMPAELAPVAQRLNWVGPLCSPAELPSFEIAHYGEGRSELVKARWGAEARLTPQNLPDTRLPSRITYCGPLADPGRQLAFIQHFHHLGQRTAVGTYGRAVRDFFDIVYQTFLQADIFFCNENEARLLFGAVEHAATASGRLLFITLGERGALVIQGDYRTHVPGLRVDEFDPTGAGDTFAGTTLALLARGAHPAEAARQAVAAAAEMVTALGPQRLLAPPPPPAYPDDARVIVNAEQCERVAALIARLPDIHAFDFTGEAFPPIDHPAAPDYFFASVLQQFGFWSDDGQRYREPLLAPFGGHVLKGSDYLFAVYRRWLDDQPGGLTPESQAILTPAELAARFRSDTGDVPLPVAELYLNQARAYGRDMTAQGWSPAHLLARANQSERPLSTLLSFLDQVGGYKEDPLRKKAVLLGIILQQRPERFLRVEPDEPVPPIIDYHLQRSCLRIGLIEVKDDHLSRMLIHRHLLPAKDEWAVRRAAYTAIEQVQRLSHRSMGAVDYFFFGARRRCPEMTEPDCAQCPVDPVCAHRTDLFQPVFRTVFY